MRQNEHGQYVSDDGFWVWDGAQWVPTNQQPTGGKPDEQSTGSAAAAHESSGGGTSASRLDGADDAAVRTAETSGAAREHRVRPEVDRSHPLSPDGRHWWTGDEWVPVDETGALLGTSEVQATPEPTVQTSSPATGFESQERTGYSAAEAAPTTSASSYPAADTGDIQTGGMDTGGIGTAGAGQAGTGAPHAAGEGPAATASPAAETGSGASQQGGGDTGQRQLSPDGYWEWDGSQWVPAQQRLSASGRQLSPDGQWEWDGTQWVPAGQSGPVEVPAGAHVSPDGHWWWNGTQWVPTGR